MTWEIFIGISILLEILTLFGLVKVSKIQKEIKLLSGKDKSLSRIGSFCVYFYMFTFFGCGLSFLIVWVYYLELFFEKKRLLILLSNKVIKDTSLESVQTEDSQIKKDPIQIENIESDIIQEEIDSKYVSYTYGGGVWMYSFIYPSRKNEYEVINLVEKHSFVKKGDILVKIKNFGEKKCFFIRSEHEGIFEGHNYWGTTINTGDTICEIFDNEDILFSRICSNRVEFSVDKFSRQQRVEGIVYAGTEGGFHMGRLKISFICQNGEHNMRVEFCRKNITFLKNYTLQFLFSDNSLISLENKITPIKDTLEPSNSFISIKLLQQDVNLFLEKDLLEWRIINDDKIEIATGKNNCCRTDNLILTETLSIKAVKDFMVKYLALSSKIERVEPIKTEQKDENDKQNQPCYVYLMIDTVNNFHKIGISNKPKYREHTLQSDKPSIELLYAKKYPSRLIAEGIEKGLHKAFEAKRIRGEWFDLDEHEIQTIKETLS